MAVGYRDFHLHQRSGGDGLKVVVVDHKTAGGPGAVLCGETGRLSHNRPATDIEGEAKHILNADHSGSEVNFVRGGGIPTEAQRQRFLAHAGCCANGILADDRRTIKIIFGETHSRSHG